MFKQQDGNVFFALFGAVAMVGVLGVTVSHLLSGPTRGVSEITRQTVAQNDMIAASTLLSEAALAQSPADCDTDGMVEPLAPASGAGSLTGGGRIPASIGATKTDPWGTPYGYCAWDHGTKIKDAACNAASFRLSGGNTSTATVIALVSAGPDKIFQSSCDDWVNDATPAVNKPSGSDDIFRVVPYGQFLLPNVSQTQLTELPDEACTPQTVGMMRMMLGSVQICSETGWTDVGSATQASGDFNNIVNAELSSTHTSNVVSFTGFFGKKTIMATGGATLVINGAPAGTSGQIEAEDEIQLTATAAATPETESRFGITVSGVQKAWLITTRDAYPASLSIQPNSAPFSITGPGSPAYSDPQGFIVRNTGEAATAVFQTSVLSNGVNFSFHADGSYQGDGCVGKTLSHDDTCIVDVRAHASGGGSYSGTLDVSDGVAAVSAALNATAAGWTCPLPWGGTAADGDIVTAYQNSTVPFGGSCVSAQRVCTGGALDGPNYTNQSCTVQAASNCTLDGVTVSHNSSRLFYSATSAPSCSAISQSRQCNNGNFNGTSTYNRASCTDAGVSCTLDGVTVAHNSSRTFYNRTSVPHGQYCSTYGTSRTCNNGTLNGTTTYNKASCTVAACSSWAWVDEAPGCGGGPGNNYRCWGVADGGKTTYWRGFEDLRVTGGGGPYQSSMTCNSEHLVRYTCNWKTSPCASNYRAVRSECKCAN